MKIVFVGSSLRERLAGRLVTSAHHWEQLPLPPTPPTLPVLVLVVVPVLVVVVVVLLLLVLIEALELVLALPRSPLPEEL
jgi:hypothetical protein